MTNSPGYHLLALVLSALLGIAHATTYTIDNQSDFDDLRTATFSPGDEILFRRGSIFTGMFAPRGSGTAGQPIRIDAYATGPLPVINAMGENVAGVYLHNVEYWEIHNLEITNTDGSTGDQGDLRGIYVLIDTTSQEVMDHYHISNCYIHDVNGNVGERFRGGIHVHTLNTDGNDPFRINDLRITDNTIMDVGGVGIGNRTSYVDLPNGIDNQLWTNVYVARNYISNTGRNAIIARVSKDAVYEHNTLANSSRFSTGHSMYNFETSGFVGQFNEAYGNTGGGNVDRGGFDADYNSEDTTYQYNYSHDNRWFMGIMCRWNKGVTIRYNISQNETEGIYWYGFDDESLLEDVAVYNNVHFTRSSLAGVLVNAGDRRIRNTTFSNNIFSFAGSGDWGASAGDGANVTFRHNLFHNVPVWPHGGDPGAVTSDPLFVNPGSGGSDLDMTDPDRLSGYRLQPGSPAIDAGTFIAGVTRDFWGNSVPAGTAPDIGVFEAQPAANVPPTVSLSTPADGAVIGLPSPVDFAATAADGDGSVSLVEFRANGSLVGQDTTPPYTFTWSAPVGNHILTAVAQDNEGARTTSAPRTVTVTAQNLAPTISLTSPAPGAIVNLPDPVALAATASDADGQVTKVAFYHGGVKLFEDTTAPYSFSWAAPAGVYAVYAVASDDDGATSTSTARSVTVTEGNMAPSVVLTSPADGSVVTLPALVEIGATASDDDGSVARVEFFAGGDKIGEDTTAPYAFVWNPGPGSYVLTAVATDDVGGQTTSAARSITVMAGANAPPSIALTSPEEGETITLPGFVDFAADASDLDGSIAVVQFFRDGILVGSDTTAPFSFFWPAPQGDYVLTAVAEDDRGSRTTSSPVSIVVSNSAPPSVTLTSPSDGSTIPLPGPVNFAATASDSDGAIAVVEFHRDGEKVAEDTSAPYVATWQAPPGTYVLTAIARDDEGARTTSAPATVTVTNQSPAATLTSPTDGTTVILPNTVNLAATASDADGSVVRVEFFEGENKISEDSSAPYTATWTPSPGTYTVTAVAEDEHGARTTSTHASVTVVNPAPTASLIAPDRVEFPATVTLTASVNDAEGDVVAVEFFEDGNRFAVDSAAPFEASWNPAVGDYVLTAVAENNFGARTTSSPISVSVVNELNDPPAISLLSPADGSTLPEGTVSLTASAADTDGSVVKVEFFAGDTEVGVDLTAPYEASWSPTPGSYTLTAVATDNDGSSSISSAITVTVVANLPPTVSLTRPNPGENLTGGTANLAASASDADGSISLVEFFAGPDKVGEDATRPFEATWAAVPVGSYSLTAVATDDDGAKATSEPVPILMTQPTSLTFQEGVDGYSGTEDTYVRSAFASTNYGGITVISVDADDGSGISPNHALIRFPSIIGSEAAQIPPGSSITRAELTVNVFNTGSGFRIHRMLTPWSEADTWNSLGDGIQTDGVEAVADAAGSIGADNDSPNVAAGERSIEITSAVQAWVDGATNHGLALLPFPNGTNGVDFYTSEWFTAAQRPRLRVEFAPPAPPFVSVAVSDGAAGEWGSDALLGFTLTRTGDTTAALAVTLVAGGEAIAGADYSGFTAAVEIPAGLANADLLLTVLPDEENEGDETVRISLGSGSGFLPGTPDFAEGVIADRPLQDWLRAELPGSPFDAPADHGDVDPDANLVEYFKGTRPGDETSFQPLLISAVSDLEARVRFPRAVGRPDVSGAIFWSRDLVTWRSSGESDGDLTVTLSEQVVSNPGVDPEVVEMTATLSGAGAAAVDRLFFHLSVSAAPSP